MASVSSTSSSLPVDWVRGALNESEAASDTAIGKSRNIREFATRTQPDLVNRYAARGTFFSGGTSVASDRALEDSQNANADLDRMLARTRNQLQLNRFLAAIGLS